MQVETLQKCLKKLETMDWGDGHQVQMAHIKLFEDGSGKFVITVSSTDGQTASERLHNWLHTTDYQFPFESVEFIERACADALSHKSQHPEVLP